MSLVEDLSGALAAFQPPAAKQDELKRLSEFYERMKREGIAMTREYDLPPLDTIGRRALAYKARG